MWPKPEPDRPLGFGSFGAALYDNTFSSGPGSDAVTGGGLADKIVAGDGDDVIMAGRGNDEVEVGGGSDRVSAGPDYDLLSYQGLSRGVSVDLTRSPDVGGEPGGPDVIWGVESWRGSSNADRFRGSPYADSIDGWGGEDLLYGGGGPDFLGGLAEARVYGGEGNDQLSFGAEAHGGPGADYIDGMRRKAVCGPGPDQVNARVDLGLRGVPGDCEIVFGETAGDSNFAIGPMRRVTSPAFSIYFGLTGGRVVMRARRRNGAYGRPIASLKTKDITDRDVKLNARGRRLLRRRRAISVLLSVRIPASTRRSSCTTRSRPC